MEKFINAQLIVANKIIANYQEKLHSIENILNHMVVPTFPAVVINHVLIKILYSPDMEKLITNSDISIQVINPAEKLIHNELLEEKVSNCRGSRMMPGMDVPVEIRFPVVMEGIYKYMLFIGANHHSIYYLSIFNEELMGSAK